MIYTEIADDETGELLLFDTGETNWCVVVWGANAELPRILSDIRCIMEPYTKEQRHNVAYQHTPDTTGIFVGRSGFYGYIEDSDKDDSDVYFDGVDDLREYIQCFEYVKALRAMERLRE